MRRHSAVVFRAALRLPDKTKQQTHFSCVQLLPSSIVMLTFDREELPAADGGSYGRVVTPNVVYAVRPWASVYVSLDVCQYCRMGFSIDTTCRPVQLFPAHIKIASAK